MRMNFRWEIAYEIDIHWMTVGSDPLILAPIHFEWEVRSPVVFQLQN